MNEQQIIDQMFKISDGTLVDWRDWSDENEPEHNPNIPIRLCLVSSENYQLYYGGDLINEETFTYQWETFADDYLFIDTSRQDCRSLFNQLKNALPLYPQNILYIELHSRVSIIKRALVLRQIEREAFVIQLKDLHNNIYLEEKKYYPSLESALAAFQKRLQARLDRYSEQLNLFQTWKPIISKLKTTLDELVED